MNEHRYFCIVWGRWKFMDWHLYRLTPHQDAYGRWFEWDRVL